MEERAAAYINVHPVLSLSGQRKWELRRRDSDELLAWSCAASGDAEATLAGLAGLHTWASRNGYRVVDGLFVMAW